MPGRLEAGVTEEDLDALWVRQLMVPVAGVAPAAVRNDYDARRGARAHRALDLLAPKGTPVLAADDGRIGRLGTTPVGGNIVYAIDSHERFVYYYAHLDRHARGLAVGDRVRKGEVIGYVGTTGNAPSSVPHLHFQVMKRGAGRAWWDGPSINPWPFFVFSGAPMR
jgi:murein DD-endopeptidase MepM/ murein hydrolase activator NlpD